MSYVELYDNEILDVVSLGKFVSNFDESKGDYIKVNILSHTSNVVLGTFYSNRLLFKDKILDEFYFGDYHFHPENSDMGFCSGKKHTNESQTGLRPIPAGYNNTVSLEALDPSSKYQRQFDIFKDSKGRIYIKPNEIIKFLKLDEQKYKVRIYFLRSVKSNLGKFLKINKDNLIENGDFLAGLEPTQTGDLDRSVGRNNFIIRQNPGIGQYILEQDGIGDNIYNMRIAGVQPGTTYVFSFWVAWNNPFNGSKNIVSFETLDIMGDHTTLISNEGLEILHKTDALGSWLDDDIENDPTLWYNRPSRIINTQIINGLTWYNLFAKFTTKNDYYLGTVNVNLGTLLSDGGSTSTNARRYFTGLKLERVGPSENELMNYIQYLKGGDNQSFDSFSYNQTNNGGVM
tara:strand:+ start:281 stop:1483 length:1203 start_codon:yes stop_codon:yes gene_type:complete